MREYKEVLMRPKFRIAPRELAESLRIIESSAILVAPATSVHAASDPDDDKFLACAEAAGRDIL